MKVSLHIIINWKLQLSPLGFEQLSQYAKFKVDFHHVYIRVWKDPQQKNFDLPYLATDDIIQETIKF